MRRFLLCMCVMAIALSAGSVFAFPTSITTAVGVNNKAVATDANIVGGLVKTWGKGSASGSGNVTWFTITDGYSSPLRVHVGAGWAITSAEVNNSAAFAIVVGTVKQDLDGRYVELQSCNVGQAVTADANLIMEVRPGDYNTSTLQWPIANGKLAGDYFQASSSAIGLTSKGDSTGSAYKALDFTSASSMLGGPLCPESLGGANPRTIEAWCWQPTTVGGDNETILCLARRGSSNVNFNLLNAYNANRAIDADPYYVGWTAPWASRSGKWVYLVASYDGTTLRCYVNGASDKVDTHTYTTEAGGSMTIGKMRWSTAPVTTPHATFVGEDWNGWRGYLGSIRVYDRARTAAEVASDYASGVNYGETGVPQYAVTASAGVGGTISPSGSILVPQGGSQTFTITPNKYYDVASILNGVIEVSVGPAAQTYTMTNVTAPGSITASFIEWAQATITGKVTTDGTTGLAGVHITATGNRGPFTATTSSDGTYSIRVRPGDTYTLTALKGNYTITPASLTATAGDTGKDFVAAEIPLETLVSLDASTLTDTTDLATWKNTGTYGGTFQKWVGGIGPNVTTIAGKKCVEFVQANDQAANRRTMALYLDDLTALKYAPAAITGSSAWTVSTDVYRASMNRNNDSAYLSWAGNGNGTSRAAAFNYVNNLAYTHNGNDSGFASPVPTAGEWHNVTVTYDGTTEIIYVDGFQNKSDTRNLNIAPNKMILLGSRTDNDSWGNDNYWRFNGAIARLKVFNKALSATEIAYMLTPAVTVSGYVKEGNVGVSGATVSATSGSTAVTAVTDSNGFYSLALASGQTWTLAVSGLASGKIANPSSVELPLTLGVDVTQNFSVPTFTTLSGKVTLEDGATPIEGVNIACVNGVVPNATTAADGTYSMNVEIGAYVSVSAGKDNYLVTFPADGQYDLNVGNTPVILNFKMTLINALTGTVKDEAGAPIRNAVVQVGGVGGPVAVTGDDGSYRISGITVDSAVELYADALGYADSTQTIDTSGAATGAVTRDIVITAKNETGVVVNGGFEQVDPVTGKPAGWHEWAGVDSLGNPFWPGQGYAAPLGDDYISSTSVPGEFVSGTKGAKYSPVGDNYTFMAQEIPVIPGSSYNVYWKMKGDAGITKAFPFVEFRKADGSDSSAQPIYIAYEVSVPTIWTQYPNTSDGNGGMPGAIRVSIPADAAYISIILGCSNGAPWLGKSIYVDDVVIDRVGP